MYARARARTHTQRGKGKTDYSVAEEGVTKCAASGPFRTFCHHVVIKRAGVTKRAGSASDLTHFVTLATKRAVVTKRAAQHTLLQTRPQLVTPLKGCSLSSRSCPPTISAPSERFGYE